MIIVPFIVENGTGAGATYILVPANMTVLGFGVTPSTATGCETTVTALSGATTVGTAIIATAQAAATVTSATMHATLATRKTIVSKTVPLKINVDARTNASTIFGSVFLDEFALQRD